MSKKRCFTYEFHDTSPATLRWDYEGVDDDRFRVETRGGRVHVYVNRDSALVLARTFARIALGHYPDGFHVHLHEDFDAERPEVLVLGVSEASSED